MADLDLRDTVVAGQPSVKKSGQSVNAANHAILQNNTTMKAYLAAAPRNYTQATLHSMTRNDLVFACKSFLGLG